MTLKLKIDEMLVFFDVFATNIIKRNMFIIVWIKKLNKLHMTGFSWLMRGLDLQFELKCIKIFVGNWGLVETLKLNLKSSSGNY